VIVKMIVEKEMECRVVIVKMIVEKEVECRVAGETEVLGENLPQRHFCPGRGVRIECV
jgi:hypothetical protein